MGNVVGSLCREFFQNLNKSEAVVRKCVQDPALVQKIIEYQSRNAELSREFNNIAKGIRDEGIESFEDLKRFDEAAATALIELAIKTEPLPLDGQNFGFFGLTSAGKSSIINTIIGETVAEVGAGETTTQIQKYPGKNYNLYDIPGRNDQMSYFCMEYIAFWKGLTSRLFVITATLKEMSAVLHVIDEIGLTYDIIVNKFDNVADDERDKFKEGIRKEVKDIGLKGVTNIWFVSSKKPDQFPDWLDMVHYLTS